MVWNETYTFFGLRFWGKIVRGLFFASHLVPFAYTAVTRDEGWPFGFAQGRESFDSAQDREPVERHVERQMGVFRKPQLHT
jgi:hypothetical protein